MQTVKQDYHSDLTVYADDILQQSRGIRRIASVSEG